MIIRRNRAFADGRQIAYAKRESSSVGMFLQPSENSTESEKERERKSTEGLITLPSDFEGGASACCVQNAVLNSAKRPPSCAEPPVAA